VVTDTGRLPSVPKRRAGPLCFHCHSLGNPTLRGFRSVGTTDLNFVREPLRLAHKQNRCRQQVYPSVEHRDGWGSLGRNAARMSEDRRERAWKSGPLRAALHRAENDAAFRPCGRLWNRRWSTGLKPRSRAFSIAALKGRSSTGTVTPVFLPRSQRLAPLLISWRRNRHEWKSCPSRVCSRPQHDARDSGLTFLRSPLSRHGRQPHTAQSRGTTLRRSVRDSRRCAVFVRRWDSRQTKLPPEFPASRFQ
jgi:hypothetical protein